MTYAGPNRRANTDGPRCTYAACTIRDRTRLVRDGGWAQSSLAALGWQTLSVEGTKALMVAPDSIEPELADALDQAGDELKQAAGELRGRLLAMEVME